MEKMSQGLVNAWYRPAGWLVLLYPIAWIFQFLVQQRLKSYRSGARQSWKPTVPVIVVGNITLGGTGKTPLVIALVKKLHEKGYKPGIVSRGFGAQATHLPYEVTPKSHPSVGGDEPVLMARRLGCPILIDPDRVAAPLEATLQVLPRARLGSGLPLHLEVRTRSEADDSRGARAHPQGRSLDEPRLRARGGQGLGWLLGLEAAQDRARLPVALGRACHHAPRELPEGLRPDRAHAAAHAQARSDWRGL